MPTIPVTLTIAIGSLIGGMVAGCMILQTVAWVWEGFWGDPRPSAQLPTLNPQNRVGIAEPLGEAGFARAGAFVETIQPGHDRVVQGGLPFWNERHQGFLEIADIRGGDCLAIRQHIVDLIIEDQHKEIVLRIARSCER